MKQLLTLSSLAVKDARVILRVDFNVPFHADGTISDDSRIRAAIPTIENLRNRGASVILMSHRGRPKGKANPDLSLKACAEQLSLLLSTPVQMAENSVGNNVLRQAQAMKAGDLMLLENLRFHRGEEHPNEDPKFAEGLASLADFYVNDAFGSCHRAHASTVTVVSYFPQKAAAGKLIENEVNALYPLITRPEKPFVSIIGGAKVSSKLGILHSLLSKVDSLLIGGGMAYTFLKVLGKDIGDSLFEEALLKEAENVLKQAQALSVNLMLPLDHVIADSFSADAETKIVSADEGIASGWMGMDIGPKTTEAFRGVLESAESVLWNGPLGVFEFPVFSKGSEEVAKILARAKAKTVVGGGDSIAAVNQAGVSEQIAHLSTGGGAMLEFIEYGTLPGLEVLEAKLGGKENQPEECF
jgi:phosphoglycerate kinase